MAYTFPLALADFFDTLDLTESEFDLPQNLSVTGRTAGGEILTASAGVRLWQGTVTFMPQTYADADAVMAKIDMLGAPGRPFFVTHRARPGPRNDPNGTALAGYTPKIASIDTGNYRDITLKDMPVGLILAAGDHISWRYGTDPYYYAFYRLARGGTVNGSGNVTVETTDFIQVGAADTNVTLYNPYLKAVLVPGSVDSASYSGNLKEGISFAWRQTLR